MSIRASLSRRAKGAPVHAIFARGTEGADLSRCPALARHPLCDLLDRAQSLVPFRSDLCQRPRRGPELHGSHGVVDLAAATPAFDEAGAIEHRELLRHRLAGDRKVARERGGARLSSGEQVAEYATTSGIGHRRPELWHVRPPAPHRRADPRSSSRTYSRSSPSSRRSSSGQSSFEKPVSTTRSQVP